MPQESSRFNYVKYDELAAKKQERFKNVFATLELMAEELIDSRARSLFLTHLEEAYMWTGKAIRDEQIARQGNVNHEPARSNQ